ncbi:ABC transporter ATP-binding protein [Pirellulales bacterium]|nr:ABC transporter ATP-binding protein [Pirellulales bacterium]
MLKIQNVTKQYGDRVAVDRLDLDLQPGQLYALLGHNGAGKTTTIKMIVGLLKPNAGSIQIGPFDVVQNPREASRLTGYVPDQPFLYDKLSGREFLRFVADMYGLSSTAAQAAVERESQRFRLGEFLDGLTESYSHGMRQRTVFAAAMIHQPEFLVIDEPMVGLDPQSIRLVKDLLRNYVAAGKTVLMSTHTLGVAEEIADRIGVMRQGRQVFEGSLCELKSAMVRSDKSLEEIYLSLMDA